MSKRSTLPPSQDMVWSSAGNLRVEIAGTILNFRHSPRGEQGIRAAMDASEPRRRKLNEEVAAKRQALRLARPFLNRFEDWNHRAARHATRLLSSMTDDEQKADARVHLQILRDEVGEQFAEFLRIASTSSNSRVEDVRSAFRRLLETLDDALGRMPH